MRREMKCCRSIVDKNYIAIFHFLGSSSPYGLLEFEIERYSMLIRGLDGGPQHAATMGAQNHSVGFQLVKIPANRQGGYREFPRKFLNRQLRLQRMQLRQHLLLTLFGFHSPPNRDFPGCAAKLAIPPWGSNLFPGTDSLPVETSLV